MQRFVIPPDVEPFQQLAADIAAAEPNNFRPFEQWPHVVTLSFVTVKYALGDIAETRDIQRLLSEIYNELPTESYEPTEASINDVTLQGNLLGVSLNSPLAFSESVFCFNALINKTHPRKDINSPKPPTVILGKIIADAENRETVKEQVQGKGQDLAKKLLGSTIGLTDVLKIKATRFDKRRWQREQAKRRQQATDES